ncbi:MAG: hypothetical protein L0Z55_08190, partial [Planctomycetes bacterium]|nr:hypothetical protein [Planctomycetota bacterium]
MLAVYLCCLLSAAGPAPEALGVAGYEIALEVLPETGVARSEARVTIAAASQPAAEARFCLNRLLQVSAVECDGKALPYKEGAKIAEGRELVIALAPPLRKGERRQLTIRYEGKCLDPGPSDPDWMGVLLVRPDEIRMSHQSQWYPVLARDERALSIVPAPIRLALTLPA